MKRKTVVVVLCCLLAMAFAMPASAQLEKGSKGDAVVSLQRKLISLGHLAGKADGAFGGGTEKAVKAFQEAAGLDVTGVADDATIEALDAAYKAAKQTFKLRDGLSFGMSEEEIDAYLKEHDGVTKKEVVDSAVRYEGLEVAGDTCDLYVVLADGYGAISYIYVYPRYSAVRLNKMMDDFDKLKEALDSKYGKSSKVNEVWKNKELKGFIDEREAAGLGEYSKFITWQGEGVQVELHLSDIFNARWFNSENRVRLVVAYMDPDTAEIVKDHPMLYEKPANTDGL